MRVIACYSPLQISNSELEAAGFSAVQALTFSARVSDVSCRAVRLWKCQWTQSVDGIVVGKQNISGTIDDTGQSISSYHVDGEFLNIKISFSLRTTMLYMPFFIKYAKKLQILHNTFDGVFNFYILLFTFFF